MSADPLALDSQTKIRDKRTKTPSDLVVVEGQHAERARIFASYSSSSDQSCFLLLRE
jgi:hypothetical protein